MRSDMRSEMRPHGGNKALTKKCKATVQISKTCARSVKSYEAKLRWAFDKCNYEENVECLELNEINLLIKAVRHAARSAAMRQRGRQPTRALAEPSRNNYSNLCDNLRNKKSPAKSYGS